MHYLTTRGDALTRGRRHGEALGDAIRRALQLWVGDAELGEQGHRAGAWLQRECPDAVDEMRGIAEGAALAYEQVLLLTIRNSFTVPAHGCTTVVLRAADGSAALGKTQDVGLVEAELQLIHDFADEAGRRTVISGLVGTVWTVAGMNAAGLCAGINSAPTLLEPQSGDGLPQHQALYPLVKHHDRVGDALAWWLPRPLLGRGINGCLCDAGGDAVVFERSAARWAVTRGFGSLHHTNHYRDPALLAASRTPPTDNSLRREAYLTERLSGRLFDSPADEARRLLEDVGEPGMPCQAIDGDGGGTHSAYVADPVTGTFLVSDGPPSAGEWREYRLRG
ncbi:MAG: hypothetical protein HYU66_10525 [Armatimonadetes bacterium]|nr:hypothetical protein [Armatimonadota bacterium]